MCNMRVILLGAVVGLSNFVANATDVVTRHDEDTSPFQIYDNNAMVGYYNAVEGNGDSGGGFALNVEALLDNNIWLSANGGYLLYVARAAVPLNKITGASFGLSGGYAFPIAKSLNLIPFISAEHNGLSMSNGSASSAVSYSDAYGLGLLTEYDIIPKNLKARLNTNFMSQNTKTSFVGSGYHPDISSYTTFITIAPSIQWNITDPLTTQFTYANTTNTLNMNNANTINFSLGLLF